MTYKEWLKDVDRAVLNFTSFCGEAGCLSRGDFADTVFLVDAFNDGEEPKEVAERILENDSIGLSLIHI